MKISYLVLNIVSDANFRTIYLSLTILENDTNVQ